jgi:hypothetical protein
MPKLFSIICKFPVLISTTLIQIFDSLDNSDKIVIIRTEEGVVCLCTKMAEG